MTAVLMGYAHPHRQGAANASRYHVVLTEALHTRRLHRQPGDALCRPDAHFDLLDTGYGEERRREGKPFSCKPCVDMAARLGIDLEATP